MKLRVGNSTVRYRIKSLGQKYITGVASSFGNRGHLAELREILARKQDFLDVDFSQSGHSKEAKKIFDKTLEYYILVWSMLFRVTNRKADQARSDHELRVAAEVAVAYDLQNAGLNDKSEDIRSLPASIEDALLQSIEINAIAYTVSLTINPEKDVKFYFLTSRNEQGFAYQIKHL